MIPIHLNEDSVGAPALTGEPGSLYSVLKWALPELGWTLEFDDAAESRAMFRSNATQGAGMYLRIEDDQAFSTFSVDYIAKVQGFMSAASLDPATPPVPADNNRNFWMKCTNGALTLPRNWDIVGTDRAFYFSVRTHSDPVNVGNKGALHFAGEVVPLSAVDPYPCVVAKSAVNFNSATLGPDYSSKGWHAVNHVSDSCVAAWLADPAGIAGEEESKAYCFSVADAFRLGDFASVTNPVGGNKDIAPVLLTHGSRYRGYLPGLLNVGNARADYVHRQTIADLDDGFGGVADLLMLKGLSIYPLFHETNNTRASSMLAFNMTKNWDFVL